MKLYNSLGPNPRLVRLFMLEKGIELATEEIDTTLKGSMTLEVIIDTQADVYPMVGPGLSYRDMLTGDFIPNRYDKADGHEPDPSEMF